MKCVLCFVCADRELVTASAPNNLGLWNKHLIFIQMLVRFYLFATILTVVWEGRSQAGLFCSSGQRLQSKSTESRLGEAGPSVGAVANVTVFSEG